ncbi:MAG: response regulator [Magnetococcales bacterium]|nr:response regulator [Magnetococcales bacterium]
MEPSAEVVLVVDDQTSVRAVVANIVRDCGLIPREAGDGIQALSMLADLKRQGVTVQLVVTDLYMPGMDGIALIREIRQADKRTPIVMLTTESDPDKRNEGRQAGANAWVVKPLNPERFAEVLRRFANP